jgi:flagellar biogenesis protein FliO
MNESNFAVSFWDIMFPIYYLVSAVLYIIVFVYLTKKILNNNSILPGRKTRYITLLSCYFYFPMIIYWLIITSSSPFFVLYFLIITVCGLLYLIYAVKKIVHDEHISNTKKTLYILTSAIIWFFGFFLYASQVRTARLKKKYQTKVKQQ